MTKGGVIMFRALFELWYDAPWWLRVIIALVPLLISTALFFFADTIWPWGWAVGGVLLLFSGRSQSEKKGYHF